MPVRVCYQGRTIVTMLSIGDEEEFCQIKEAKSGSLYAVELPNGVMKHVPLDDLEKITPARSAVTARRQLRRWLAESQASDGQ